MPFIQRVHLVRHGETVGAGAAYVGDPILTDVGQKQSEITADSLRELGVSSVLVSPLLRAQQTAAPLAAIIDPAPRTISALTEISLGDYPGDREVGRKRPMIEFEAWGGDSGAEFSKRAIAGFQQLVTDIRNDAHEDVAVITRGGTINVILDHIEGIPFDGEMRRLLANCSVSTLELGPDSVAMADINGVTHLPGRLITPRGEFRLPGGPGG